MLTCKVQRHVRLWDLAFVLAALLGTGGASLAQGRFIRGDANGDLRLDISDAVFTLQYLFLGGGAPACEDAADANDDGDLDLSDAVSVLQSLFLTGLPLLPPGPEPGPDPTADPLTCGIEAPGFGIRVTLAEDFNRALITGLGLVFDTAPGGPLLELEPLPPGGGGVPAPFQLRVVSVDRDPELELVATLEGNPFAASNVFEAFLPAFAGPGFAGKDVPVT
ncbi:MAG: hypothetical protein ACRD2T_12965, partial [Thermoanaerobaculia bacterium]